MAIGSLAIESDVLISAKRELTMSSSDLLLSMAERVEPFGLRRAECAPCFMAKHG